MFDSKFIGREPLKRPTCPFCTTPIERPMELSTRRPGEMPVGSCSCGAIYACDETGHNQGAAMIEALVFGCNMDWDLAWGLLPEEDYLQKIVDNYDFLSHLIVSSGCYEGRRIAGILYFIRLHEDIREVTGEGVRKRLEKTAPASPKPQLPRGKSLSKKEVEDHVKGFETEPILKVAGQDRKLIRNLQRLLYSGDDLFRKRAAEILGQVCQIVAENNPGIVARLLEGLFVSIMDTAASSWGAFEAIGEIISHKTDLFAGHTPRLYQFLSDETRRAQVLQALGRIAKARPDLLRNVTFHFIPFLSDPDPLTRGYTAMLLGNLNASETKVDLKKLTEETHEIDIYKNGQLKKRTVGHVALEALKKSTA